MVEVGDVRGALALPADLDRLAERVEVAVAERVADVRVVEPAVSCGLGRELGELIGAGIGAGRVVQAGREADGALLHRLAQDGAHVGDIARAGLDLLPADGGHAAGRSCRPGTPG